MAADGRPVIYEVALAVEPSIVRDFDRWLRHHVEEMLRFEGFESARILTPGPEAETGRSRRVVQYYVADRERLDRYLRDNAERMRADGQRRFGERMSASRQIHAAAAELNRSAVTATRTCRNCGSPLSGQYCAECGQRDKSRMVSMWELVRDFIGDVFEVDSRLWRTVMPLLAKPGFLTREYLRGRRVHYTPPLRMYLVTSLLFFLVAFFGGEFAELNVVVNGDGGDADTAALLDGAAPAAEDPAADGADPPAAAPPSTGAGGAPADEAEEDDEGFTPQSCAEEIQFDSDIAWLEPTVVRICERLAAEGGGRRFGRALVDNAPTLMFVLLPVIAVVFKLLYPLSRRYYVEHLLFLVHYHSFFFLIITLTVLLQRAPSLLPGQGVFTGLVVAAVSVYVPVYLFVAMRRVYEQGFVLTALKYGALCVAYLFGATLTLAVGVVWAALTV